MVVSLFMVVLFVGLILGLPSTQVAIRRWRQRRATTVAALLLGQTRPEDRLAELSAVVHRGRRLGRRNGVTYLVPVGPIIPLTEAQCAELHGLRACGYTWAELEACAPMWGLDGLAVAAERVRLEAALALPPTEEK